MNERIRELAEQAGLRPFEDCGTGYVYKMEKFAELIVLECASIADRNQAEDMGWDISEIIKEHFGIKE